ncbi:RNA polymerase sigma factor [Propionimicrobium lymphophilum]|uniref:RNA polymerase sigma factor n=1 Tax=Propionimicrobium lymphophilum TaxID=33012 RepID=UPI0003FDA6B0|nr:sigma-70 family RNA polymerase sigma factor [Propionimicrobium lymphophilum]
MATREDFQQLLAEETPALFRRALLLCHDWHFAEDLVQETAEKMLRQWKKVSAAETPGAYCQQILTNIFLSFARKRGYQETPVNVFVPEEVDPWESIDTELSVAKALATLSPLERAVVIGRYIDDLPVAQIASMLGKSEAWVRVSAHRSLQKLNSLDSTAEKAGETNA